MKIHTKLTFLGTFAILSSSPLVLANKAAPDAAAAAATAATVTTDTTVVEPAIVKEGTVSGTDAGVIVKENTDTGTKVEVTPTEGEVIDTTKDGGITGEVTHPVDPVVIENHTGEETPVPLDWIKRTNLENPDVIFYNMAGGPAPVFKNETSPIAKQIGPDGKATAIEGKENSGASPLNREKKGPVALVKKGRVFLR